MDEQINGLCPNCNNIARTNRSRDAQENAELAGGILVLLLLAIAGIFKGIGWFCQWWARDDNKKKRAEIWTSLGLKRKSSVANSPPVEPVEISAEEPDYTSLSSNSLDSTTTMSSASTADQESPEPIKAEFFREAQGPTSETVEAALVMEPPVPPPLPPVRKSPSQARLIRFQCDNCGARLTAMYTKLGRTTPCPKCQSPVKVVEGMAASVGEKPSPSPTMSNVPPPPPPVQTNTTPWHQQTAVIAFSFLLFWPAGFVLIGLHPGISSKTKKITFGCLAGFFVFVMIVGTIGSIIDAQRADVADALWDQGKRAEAVAVYDEIIGGGKR